MLIAPTRDYHGSHSPSQDLGRLLAGARLETNRFNHQRGYCHPVVPRELHVLLAPSKEAQRYS